MIFTFKDELRDLLPYQLHDQHLNWILRLNTLTQNTPTAQKYFIKLFLFIFCITKDEVPSP